MLRLPLNRHVDQGILPSLKNPPSFHDQRQKLQRVKTGYLLKHNLKKGPIDESHQVQRHILEESSIDTNQQNKATKCAPGR
ncbi:hypothetical protein NPIL_112071 [Nephila pilipes]|uniref:Uncharacterized protein n=1 Tax=Nephila pilipes TaxID=299642 RepID=A0A8X6UPE5_NEPPI|nr:hypothetical protein NPIL_682661 [Nephila pilipes]GFS60707.1 hypothetical protein NPIL_31181 [Nephila pilipes]GFT50307.1 hypothetical protein NPIL_443591 [Nephila pilipes]GFU36648.1 hypothetical protein NPIL_112071 [Nephila pilipes]